MNTHRIICVMLCIVTGFALTAFAAKVAPAPDPSGLDVSNVTSDSITISWTSGGGTTDGFIVAYLEGDTFPAAQCLTGTQVNVGMNTSFVLDNLAADTTVSFRVCAYNSKNQRSTGMTVQGTTLGGGPAEPGISWQPDAVKTSEGGQTDSISVVLDSQPTSDVVILVTSSNEAEAIVSTDTLTFTAQNWNQQQTVAVTGVDDQVEDGSVDYFIDMVVDPSTTADSGYAALDAISILGQNADDDGVVVTSSSADTPLTIKDYNSRLGASPTISQVDFPYSDSSKIYIKSIQLDVSISHANMSQLTVWLISPSNTECELQYDGTQWVLTDPGIFRGEDIAGAWTLEVTDHVKRTVGTLDGWSITVTPRNRSYVFKEEDGLTFRVEVHSYGTDDVRPGIFVVHGGGFILGDRFEIIEGVIEDLLDDEFVIMSVDYRLAPESKMSDAWDDISDGYQWVLNNGPSLFHLDPMRVAVYGESAGSFYAQLAGYRLSPRPKAVVSFYGANDLLGTFGMEPGFPGWIIDEEYALATIGDEPLLSGDFERRFYYGYCRQQVILPFEVTGLDPIVDASVYDTLFCPLRNVTADYPPTILVHGTEDNDVPLTETYNMIEALTAADVPWEVNIVQGGGHVLDTGSADPADIEAAFLQVRSFLDDYVKQAP